MSLNFRIKKKSKNKIKDDIKNSKTLENKYRNKIDYFNKKYENIDKLKKKLLNVDSELTKININKDNNIKFDLNKRAKLIKSKQDILNEIDDIEKKNEEMTYFDNVGDLISNYYDLRDNPIENISKPKNILHYFNNNNNNNNNNDLNKAKLFDKYCQIVEGVKINKDDGSNRIIYCDDCKIEKILDSSKSAYICNNCGDMEIIIIDEDRQIKDYSPYKRINHFKEWLNQFQAKESTNISEDVFKNIIKEITKSRINDYNKLDRNLIQLILKKLGYNKLYEHIPFIINKLTNLPAPKIDSHSEKDFINMFIQIQEPWELYKPKGRKNFLSYPYILFKFSELLELDHLLEHFPMLKQNKLMEQDKIWKKFCKHLNWEFYPTT